MSREIQPFYRLMDRAWHRDKNNIVYHGESLVLAMLLKVKKGKNRTAEQEAELQSIIEKPARRNRR